MGAAIRHFRELDVYNGAMEAAMEIYELSKGFPAEERYSLTDQLRRSSRSVCANIAEGWRKRRYPNAFVSKLSDAEAEAAETQVWLEMALRCKYLDPARASELELQYEHILGKLVNMISRPEQWTIRAIHDEGADYA
ncbi:MAG: four helix bundle protein [Anaerolineae bacterium]|nr:four helix bundle protein [Anaerolineae bacterium]